MSNAKGTTSVKCRIRGIAPLLQPRFAVEDNPEDKVKRKQKVFSSKDDAEKSLYRDAKGKPAQPAIHIESAMIKAAGRFILEGKQSYRDVVKAGIFCEPKFIPHKIDKWVIDRQPEVVNKARIMRSRPRFDEWELEFTMNIIDDRAQIKAIEDILTAAGMYCGIGDKRPRYGRFEVLEFKPLK